MEEETMTRAAGWINHEGEKVRHEFLKVLASRRKESVPLVKTPGVHRDVGFSQPKKSTVNAPTIDSCPRGLVADSEPAYVEENFFLTTEAGEQGRVPVLLLRPVEENARRPAVVFLHYTNGCKEVFQPDLEAFAARGYVAVAIDCRYHGERAASVDSYNQALVSAWKSGDTMPFIYDTVWDLIKLLDYLSERQDVDPGRIGVLGISLGGMHAWFAAVADPRLAVVVPIIGVQNFSWAVSNESWHARVQSIPHAFEVAKEDLGKATVDAQTVAAVWQRIAPGLMERFDADHTIPSIAPRPLLIINGEQDPRCPVKGLEKTLTKAVAVYKAAGFPEHFQFKAEEGVNHTFSESMGHDASVWIDHFLKPDKPLRSTMDTSN